MDNENKKRSKRGFKINVFDVLIILLVLALIAGVIVRYTVLDKIDKASAFDSYNVYFEVSGISDSELEALNNTLKEEGTDDNWVYLSDGVTKVGSMVKDKNQLNDILSPNPAQIEMKDENGKTIIVSFDKENSEAGEGKELHENYHIKYDVENILIICEGFYSGETGSFLLNGSVNIAPGSELELQTKYGDFTMKVTAIEKAEAAQ